MSVEEPASDSTKRLTKQQIRALYPDLALTDRKLTYWIRKGIRGNKLKATLVGNHWRITPADLEAFLAQLTQSALPQPVASA